MKSAIKSFTRFDTMPSTQHPAIFRKPQRMQNLFCLGADLDDEQAKKISLLHSRPRGEDGVWSVVDSMKEKLLIWQDQSCNDFTTAAKQPWFFTRKTAAEAMTISTRTLDPLILSGKLP
ncbi:MAG TPA: hypothetical protein VEI52_01160 [Terriglobales bacterium]|nr:hypothetical protein [Terriglobales bacterium]